MKSKRASEIFAPLEKKMAEKEKAEMDLPTELEFDDARRSKLQILVDILKLIQRKGGYAKPTHILYGANLSHVRLTKYLNWLLMKNFIEEVDAGGHKAYRVTAKGFEFMREFRKISEFSEAFGIPI